MLEQFGYSVSRTEDTPSLTIQRASRVNASAILSGNEGSSPSHLHTSAMQLAMWNRGSKLLEKYPRVNSRARAKRGFVHSVKRVNKGRGETAGFRCDGLGKLCCDRKVDMRRNESRQRIGRHGCIGRNQSAQRATGRRDTR